MLSLEEELKQKINTIVDFPKAGIAFKDINPIFQQPELVDKIAMSFFNNFNGIKIDAVAGIESRGFLIGPIIANYFKVPFILIRKKGKLPGETVSMQYDLEYGSAEIEIQKSSIQPSSNILIHDDLLATGGTASAAAKLIKKMGANIAGFCFIINLSDLQGLTTLKHYNAPIVNLVNF